MGPFFSFGATMLQQSAHKHSFCNNIAINEKKTFSFLVKFEKNGLNFYQKWESSSYFLPALAGFGSVSWLLPGIGLKLALAWISFSLALIGCATVVQQVYYGIVNIRNTVWIKEKIIFK